MNTLKQKARIKTAAIAFILASTFMASCFPFCSVNVLAAPQETGNIVYGDVSGDGEVDTEDATLVLKYDAGMIKLTEKQSAAADVSFDGEADAVDALLMLKYIAGKIDIYPQIVVQSITAGSGGQTVSVDVEILNNPGITSLKFEVAYDSGLALKSVVFNPDFGIYVTAPEPYTDPQPISLISPLSEIKTNGKFATLTFDVDPSVKPGAKLNVGIIFDQDNTFNASFSDVAFKTINGTVTVS